MLLVSLPYTESVLVCLSQGNLKDNGKARVDVTESSRNQMKSLKALYVMCNSRVHLRATSIDPVIVLASMAS